MCSYLEAVQDRLRLREEAAASPGDLALVQLAKSDNTLAITTADMGESFAIVKSQVDAHRYNLRADREGKAEAVRQWVSSVGEEQCVDLMQQIPLLVGDSTELCSRPTLAGVRWFRCVSPVVRLAPKFLGIRYNEDQAIALRGLTEDWLRAHRVIEHLDQTPLVDPPVKKGKTKPTCLEAHHCLCGDAGTSLWKLSDRLTVALRKACRNLEVKQLMRSGDIVLNLAALDDDGYKKCIDEGDDRGDFSESSTDPLAFAHISLLYENPFRPTLRCLPAWQRI